LVIIETLKIQNCWVIKILNQLHVWTPHINWMWRCKSTIFLIRFAAFRTHGRSLTLTEDIVNQQLLFGFHVYFMISDMDACTLHFAKNVVRLQNLFFCGFT